MKIQNISDLADEILDKSKGKGISYKVFQIAPKLVSDFPGETSLSIGLLQVFQKYQRIQDIDAKEQIKKILGDILEVDPAKLESKQADRYILEKILQNLETELSQKSPNEKAALLAKVKQFIGPFENSDLQVEQAKHPHLVSDKQALERLVNTFKPEKIDSDNQIRTVILEHLVKAIYYGNLTINGQPPDAMYALGEYIMHGGRIFFDLSQLDPEERQQFKDYIMPTSGLLAGRIEKRSAATHAIGMQKNDKGEEVPVDVKLGMLGGVTSTGHFGMDVAIGGFGRTVKNYENKSVTVKNDGEFGHLYVNSLPDQPGIQLGFEEAKSLHTNQYTGDFHSPTGAGGSYSAFGTTRLNDVKPPQVSSDARAPMTVSPVDDANSKYNWNRVVITKETLQKLANDPSDVFDRIKTGSQDKNVVRCLTEPHPQSVLVTDTEKRYQDMLQYRKEQKFYSQPKTTKKEEVEEKKESPKELTQKEASDFLMNLHRYIIDKWKNKQMPEDAKEQLSVISKAFLAANHKNEDVNFLAVIDKVVEIGKKAHGNSTSIFARFTPFSNPKDSEEFFAVFTKPRPEFQAIIQEQKIASPKEEKFDYHQE